MADFRHMRERETLPVIMTSLAWASYRGYTGSRVCCRPRETTARLTTLNYTDKNWDNFTVSAKINRTFVQESSEYSSYRLGMGVNRKIMN